jgi:hypothetical protein
MVSPDLDEWRRRRALQFPVGKFGGLVDGFLRCILGMAYGFLAAPLRLLNGAFAFHPVGTCRFADALFRLADGFIGRTFDLVGCASHHDLLCMHAEPTVELTGSSASVVLHETQMSDPTTHHAKENRCRTITIIRTITRTVMTMRRAGNTTAFA